MRTPEQILEEMNVGTTTGDDGLELVWAINRLTEAVLLVVDQLEKGVEVRNL